MNARRSFLQRLSTLGLGSFLGATGCTPRQTLATPTLKAAKSPLVLSTWNNQPANNAAWAVLAKGGTALDAVEKGVMIPEADPNDHSVGYGGYPDRDGNVTLDACIMDERGRCGAVAALEHIKHPIQIARLVMEKTPHWMLAGDGALQFALAQGFQKENLLTEEAKKEWEKWLASNKYQPQSPINHDTIGMVAIDGTGNLSGACTTSGAAWKMHGRVGDSPIIGAGLYVDNEVGAATATGLGEMVVRVCGSHTIVELMRQGLEPEEACRQAMLRLVKMWPDHKGQQVGFLALRRDGVVGAYGLRPNFEYAVSDEKGSRTLKAKYLFEWS